MKRIFALLTYYWGGKSSGDGVGGGRGSGNDGDDDDDLMTMMMISVKLFPAVWMAMEGEVEGNQKLIPQRPQLALKLWKQSSPP